MGEAHASLALSSKGKAFRQLSLPLKGRAFGNRRHGDSVPGPDKSERASAQNRQAGLLPRRRRLDRVEQLHRLDDADRLPRLDRRAVTSHLALSGGVAPVERAVERSEDGRAGYGR